MKTSKVLLAACLLAVIMLLGFGRSGEASWLARFSLTTLEGYGDNFRFSNLNKNGEDFVSRFIPALTLIHKEPWQTDPDFAAHLNAAGEYFVRHSTLNNFGDNLRLSAAYRYPYSPRLTFSLSEFVQRQSESRTGGNQESWENGIVGGQSGVGGSTGFTNPWSQYGFGELGKTTCRRTTSLGREHGFDSVNNSFITQGQLLEDQTRVVARFQYSPALTFSGSYCWEYLGFVDAGGSELAHSIGIGGSYQIWKQHGLRARYTLSIIRSRDGHQSLVHDFDFGDNFSSEREIHLTPTLTLSITTGIAFLTNNAGNQQSGGGTQGRGSKLRLENKLDAYLTKLWEAAFLTIGVRRGLTGSLGVAGPSFTTSFFGHFSARLTQRLSTTLGAEYNSFDTGNDTFDTLQTFITFQYPITSWLWTHMSYSYRMSDAGSAVSSKVLLSSGMTNSNTIFFGFSVDADVWPRIGLVRN